jgi:hypothetical protein
MRSKALLIGLGAGGLIGGSSGYLIARGILHSDNWHDFMGTHLGVLPPCQACAMHYDRDTSYLVCDPANMTEICLKNATAYADFWTDEEMPTIGSYIIAGVTVAFMVAGGIAAWECTAPPLNEGGVPGLEEKPIVRREGVLQQELTESGWQGEVPEEFYDPIDDLLMDEPHQTQAGVIMKNYDVKTLVHLKKCPYSRLPLVDLGVNEELKECIRLFVEKAKECMENHTTLTEIVVDSGNAEQKESVAAKLPFFASSGRVKKEFICPLTKELMKDPVTASDGKTYERKAILDHIHNKKNLFSPVTKEPLKPMNPLKLKDNEGWFAPNVGLKKRIDALLRYEEQLLKDRTQAQAANRSDLQVPLLSATTRLG